VTERRATARAVRIEPWISFFAATALLLAAASPLWISGMGYVPEELASCRQILDGQPVAWPRNGAVSLAFELPLLALGRLVARSTDGQEVVVAMAPVLATAAIAALLYAWASRLAASRAWGLAIALAGTFSTILWPYAYIGLEPLQSLFLLGAAFCALERPAGAPSWTRALAFGALAGLAVSAKSVGFLLFPAVAYLFWRLFRESAASRRAAASLAVAAGIFALNTVTRMQSWQRFGGTAAYGKDWLVREPILPFLNLAALIGSPNKGLLVFAPLAVLGILTLPAAWRRRLPIAAFALLTLAGVAGGICVLGIWSDETWGPRYLHVAIPPLLLVFAATRAGRPLRLRGEIPFAAAAASGFAVSLLGVLFYYGSLTAAANSTTALTLESLQGDLTWNHPRFNARLLAAWLSGGAGPVVVPRERVWDFQDPNRPIAWRPFDVRVLATPQPRVLSRSSNPSDRRLRWACVVAAVAGAICLGGAVRAARSRSGQRTSG